MDMLLVMNRAAVLRWTVDLSDPQAPTLTVDGDFSSNTRRVAPDRPAFNNLRIYQIMVESFLDGDPTADYGVCELSKTGMFLAFTNADTTKQSLTDNLVQPGTELHIAFSVPVGGRKLRCELPAEIARITEHGIGVRFLTNDPSQLSDLIDEFANSHSPKHAIGT